MTAELLAGWLILVYLGFYAIWLRRQWQGLQLEEFHRELIAVRDDLYLMVARGELPKESPAFFEFRQVINSTIAYADRLGVIGLARAIARAGKGSTPLGLKVRASLPQETQDQLESLDRRMTIAVVQLIERRSNFSKYPLLFLCLVAVLRVARMRPQSVAQEALSRLKLEGSRALPC